MEELVSYAQRLRQVRDACDRFLVLWVSEMLDHNRPAFDRLAADIANAGRFDHDGSWIYHSRITDD